MASEIQPHVAMFIYINQGCVVALDQGVNAGYSIKSLALLKCTGNCSGSNEYCDIYCNTYSICECELNSSTKSGGRSRGRATHADRRNKIDPKLRMGPRKTN